MYVKTIVGIISVLDSTNNTQKTMLVNRYIKYYETDSRWQLFSQTFL